MADLYEVLGVARDATHEELVKAYRKAAARTHPDREGGSKEAFQAVEEAGRVLLDTEARRRYDETGARPGEVSTATQVLAKTKAVLLHHLKAGRDFKAAIPQMKLQLMTDISLFKASIEDVNIRKARLNQVFKLRKGKQSDFFNKLVQEAVAQLDMEATALTNELQFLELIMVEFDNYEIETPQMTPTRYGQDFMSMMDMVDMMKHGGRF